MNNLIKAQLQKCKYCEVPSYDDTTTELFIQQKNKAPDPVVEGAWLKIELEDYIIHPSPGFDLHTNWNAGKVPTDKVMDVEIKKLMGKMVKLVGIGVNDHIAWEGWLPRKSIKIIEKIR